MRSVGYSAYNNWLLNVGIGDTLFIPGLDEHALEIPSDMVVAEAETLRYNFRR